LRCKIAEAFGKWPHEVGKLPLHEYILCRNWVLAKDAEMSATKPEDDTWGEVEVTKAPWEADVVHSLT